MSDKRIDHIQYDSSGQWVDLDFGEGFVVRLPADWLYRQALVGVTDNQYDLGHRPHLKYGRWRAAPFHVEKG